MQGLKNAKRGLDSFSCAVNCPRLFTFSVSLQEIESIEGEWQYLRAHLEKNKKTFTLQPSNLQNYVPLPYTFLPGKPGCGTCLRVFKAVANAAVSHLKKNLPLRLYCSYYTIVRLFACLVR